MRLQRGFPGLGLESVLSFFLCVFRLRKNCAERLLSRAGQATKHILTVSKARITADRPDRKKQSKKAGYFEATTTLS